MDKTNRSVTRIAQAYLSRQAGTLNPPPAMLRKIQEWVASYAAAEFLRHSDDPKIHQRLGPRAKKNLKQGWKRAFHRFPLDLRGWEHASKFEALDPGPYRELGITINRDFRRAGATAYYSGRPKPRIVFSFPSFAHGNYTSYSSYEDVEFKLLGSARHELIHFTQRMMVHMLGQSTAGRYDPQIPSAGMPSAKIMSPQFRQHYSKMPKSRQLMVQQTISKADQLGVTMYGGLHGLDDIEFFTRLLDEIEKFKEGSAGLSSDDKRRWLRWFTHVAIVDNDPDDFGFLVQPPRELSRFTGSSPSNFFYILKRGAPGKYRRALKEIVGAVL